MRKLIGAIAADQAKKEVAAKDEEIKSLESKVAQLEEDRKADQRMWQMEEKTQQAVEDLEDAVEGKKASRALEPRRDKDDMRKFVEEKEQDERIRVLEGQVAKVEEERMDDLRMLEMEVKTQREIEALKAKVEGKNVSRGLETRSRRGDLRKAVEALTREGREKDERIEELERKLAQIEEEQKDNQRMWEMAEMIKASGVRGNGPSR